MTHKTISLQSIIYRNYLSSAVISILSIEFVLLLLYFGINFYISEKNRITLNEQVTQSLNALTFQEAQNINLQFQEVSRLSNLLQLDHQLYFKTDDCLQPNGEAIFGVHENGVFYKQNDNGGASLYYSKTTPMGSEAMHKAICSESLDPLLSIIVDTNPIVTQAYLNTWDNMNRLYPYIPDVPTQYGPQIKMSAFNFYYDADAEHNPNREHVWTDPYLDPAGQGWMISNLTPIYRGDFLEGVSGIDVTISYFIDNIINIKLPWESNTLMVDRHGSILAMQNQMETILNLKELTDHDYQGDITETIKKPQDYNILSHLDDPIKKQMQRLLDSDSPIGTMAIQGTNYLVSHRVIPETQWQMITLIEESKIYKPINELKDFTDKIGYLAIGVMLIFYAGFFLFLINKSRKLTLRIAAPVEKLSSSTTRFAQTNSIYTLDDVGITEIDNLSHNFNDLMAKITSQTNALVESRLRERFKDKEADILARLAKTDQLTGLYNRYKLNQTLQDENQRCQRSGQVYGLVIMDIDNFKQINDTYGHQIGDNVLVEMSDLIKQHTRKTDTVGRWGGEEFLIICNEASTQGILGMTEYLRHTIETHDFMDVGPQTASFGVSLSKPDDETKDLIARADKALYLAKERGRNCVELIEPEF